MKRFAILLAACLAALAPALPAGAHPIPTSCFGVNPATSCAFGHDVTPLPGHQMGVFLVGGTGPVTVTLTDVANTVLLSCSGTNSCLQTGSLFLTLPGPFTCTTTGSGPGPYLFGCIIT